MNCTCDDFLMSASATPSADTDQFIPPHFFPVGLILIHLSIAISCICYCNKIRREKIRAREVLKNNSNSDQATRKLKGQYRVFYELDETEYQLVLKNDKRSVIVDNETERRCSCCADCNAELEEMRLRVSDATPPTPSTSSSASKETPFAGTTEDLETASRYSTGAHGAEDIRPTMDAPATEIAAAVPQNITNDRPDDIELKELIILTTVEPPLNQNRPAEITTQEEQNAAGNDTIVAEHERSDPLHAGSHGPAGTQRLSNHRRLNAGPRRRAKRA